MNNYITSIKGIIANTTKEVDILLNGKNLIITGQNGCGKTQFLTTIHEGIKRQVTDHSVRDLDNIQQEILSLKGHIETDPTMNRHTEIRVSELEAEYKKISKMQISFNDFGLYRQQFTRGKALVRFFDATRQSNIHSDGNIISLSNIKKDDDPMSHESNYDHSSKFEQYLVSNYNLASNIIARNEDKAKGEKIDAWIDKVQSDLRELFEDRSLELKFNNEENAFYINQEGKKPFKFNQLSSGYSSILNVYADLLMKVELKDVSIDELSGVVFIDEIDAHLHVSLQRKILAFLDKAFPSVQFIVSTHSPFVIQSVNNSVIYDLGKLEQLEDLSMYSYESIIKGLLGTSSTSDILDNLMDDLAEAMESPEDDCKNLKEIITKLTPYKSKLNNVYRAFFLLGEAKILDGEMD